MEYWQQLQCLPSQAGSDTTIQWHVARVRLMALYSHHILTTSISVTATNRSIPFFTFKFTGYSPLNCASLTLTIWFEPQGHQLKPTMSLSTLSRSPSTSSLVQMSVTRSTVTILGLLFETLRTGLPTFTTNRSSPSRGSQIPSIHSGWSC